MRLRYPLSAFVVVALTCAGCSRTVEVKGVVTLDGTPVDGATVAFLSEDGSKTYTGFTDATGNFTLNAGDNTKGVAPGTYKVTVVKRPAMKGGEGIEAGSPDAMKMMMNEAKGEKKGPAMKMPGMPAGMPTPGMNMPMAPGVKSELPKVYAMAESTPIKIKIPPDKQPVPIELKSK